MAKVIISTDDGEVFETLPTAEYMSGSAMGDVWTESSVALLARDMADAVRRAHAAEEARNG